MVHDLKSLEVLIERMHIENKSWMSEMKDDVSEIKAQTIKTNGRVSKLEIVVAVLKFAVFTIGGGLVLAAMQVAIGKLTVGQ